MNWKTVGIVALFAAILLLLFWAIRKSMIGTDVKTGVSNDKIKKAAESVGIPAPVAESISQAPDSEAAARRIGVPVVLATAIANGIEVSIPRVSGELVASRGVPPWNPPVGKKWCCRTDDRDAQGNCTLWGLCDDSAQ